MTAWDALRVIVVEVMQHLAPARTCSPFVLGDLTTHLSRLRLELESVTQKPTPLQSLLQLITVACTVALEMMWHE
jgi:hypothetical protein